MAGERKIFAGTSGWRYAHWRHLLYPEDLEPRQWLHAYAEEFATVEVNSSFFGLLETRDIEAWCAMTPADFKFSIKADRRITHEKKLKNCDSELSAFLRRCHLFADRLGPIIFQLPTGWRANLRRLEAFLGALPATAAYVFDLRDPTWHTPDVFDLLREHQASFCIYQLHGYNAPMEAPGDLVYIRLSGPGGGSIGSYRAATLRSWVSCACGWNRDGKDVYVYFDNDADGHAVKNARRYTGFLREGPILPGEPTEG